VLYILLEASTYCFLWDELSIEYNVVCWVYLEWIKGKVFNFLPFQPREEGIPVFGIAKISCE